MDLADMFLRPYRMFPKKIATISEDGEKMNYKEFYEHCVKMAILFHEMGLKKGDRVGIIAMNRVNYMTVYAACAIARMIVVPINFRLVSGELKFIIDNSELSLAFVGKECLEAYKNSSPLNEPKLILLSDKKEDELEKLLSEISEEKVKNYKIEPVDENDTYALIYSSGTTGNPKGAMLTHRNIWCNALQLFSFRFPEEDKEDTVYIHTSPMFHIADGPTTFRYCWIGSTHVFLHFEAEKFCKLVEKYKATTCLTVPTIINMIIHHPNFGKYDLSSFRNCLYGGSPMPTELLLEATKRMPKTRFFQVFGMTELSPIATVMHVDDLYDENKKLIESRLLSCGRELMGVSVKLVDNEGNEVPIGSDGEIAIKGPNVMKGYWRNEEANKSSFTKNGYFRSGDLAYFDDQHFLYIQDRKKEMIISGGENVYSKEVENAIHKHPSVLECVVFSVPSQKWGEEVAAAVYFKPESEEKPTAEELIKFSRIHLAGYKCPKKIFIHENPLPKGGTGKLLKRVLREPFWKDYNRNVN